MSHRDRGVVVKLLQFYPATRVGNGTAYIPFKLRFDKPTTTE